MKINNFFHSFKEILKFNKIDKNYKRLVFFSENNNYSYFFKPIIDQLILKDIKLIFVTSDTKDIFLNYNSKNLISVCIPNFLFLQYFFSNLNCKNLILTMPDLGSGIINKSPFCKNYIYIFHSLISINVAYKHNSFDNYDIFFSPTKIHTDEINKKFGENNKKTFNIGYHKIKDLKDKIENIKQTKNILIAPTWGNDSSLYSNIILNLIQKLILEKYVVIFRPHPMSFIKDKKKILEITNRFQSYKNFILNTDKDNNEVLLSSEILITDWSGAALEFSLSKNKPCLFIDTNQRIRNKKIEKENQILKTTFEYICREEIGIILNDKNIANLQNLIQNLKKRETHYKNKIIDFKKKYLFNIDNSLDVTVSRIIELSNQ